MSLDMTFNGSIGGSAGLLDWGSDIARMWGIGMQNGAQLATMLRDLNMRSQLEPSYIDAARRQNELQGFNAGVNQVKAFDDATAYINSRGPIKENDITVQGIWHPYNQPAGSYADGVQRQNAVAPRSTQNTVVGNGISNSGHTNTAGGMSGGASPSMTASLQQGQYNQYGQGG